MFENPRRGRQARNFTTNVPKILDLKSSSEQIFSRKLSLGVPEVLPSVEAQLAGQLLEQHGVLVSPWPLNGRLLSVSHNAKNRTAQIVKIGFRRTINHIYIYICYSETVDNRVRIWRTGRHSPTKNSQDRNTSPGFLSDKENCQKTDRN